MLYETLLTKIRLLRRTLRKGSPLVRVTVHYNLDGDDDTDEFLISDDEYNKAADTFLERSITEEGRPKSDRVKSIINKVFRDQLWFRITPPEKPPQITKELAEEEPDEKTVAEEEGVKWTPVKTEKGYHYADERVVEIGGKEYRVEKDVELTLSLADIRDLIKEGWFELRVTAVEEPSSGKTYEDADYWWNLKIERGE